ncbi:MAG: hypothetical protein ABS75_26885 [Pelagibacterium sp. SCN 63-23]|nr:MAG: hypothetical protein ABS75_26885 [Pelagibacterium sp. SCN 63-23]
MENEIFLARYYLGLFWRHPLRWMVPMLAVIVVGAVLVLTAPRTYQSIARVAAQSPQASGTLVQSTVTSERLQFFEQRVFSRENLVALAEKLELFPPAGTPLTSRQIADRVRSMIFVQITPTDPNDPASSSAIMTIGFEADTPERAAEGAEEVIQMLVVENRNTRMSEASQVRTFLEQEVRARRELVENLETEWNAFVSTNEALLPSRMALYTAEMQELQQELQTIQIASASLAADTRVLETQLALANRPLSGATQQLAGLRQELSTKQTTYSDTHPEIVSLRARIASLEDELAQAEQTATNTTNERLSSETVEGAMLQERVIAAHQQQDEYKGRRSQIGERLDWLRTTIAAMPGVEGNLLNLQRRRTAAEESLADMQGRLDTAMVGERLEVAQIDSQISVLDKPDLPVYPTGSGRTRAMMIVGILGIAAGIACVFLLDLLDRTIKSKRDLLPVLEGATLVLIPDWKPQKPDGPKAGLATAVLLGALATSPSVEFARAPTSTASSLQHLVSHG